MKYKENQCFMFKSKQNHNEILSQKSYFTINSIVYLKLDLYQ